MNILKVPARPNASECSVGLLLLRFSERVLGSLGRARSHDRWSQGQACPARPLFPKSEKGLSGTGFTKTDLFYIKKQKV